VDRITSGVESNVIIDVQPAVTPIIGRGRNYKLLNDVSYRWENKEIVIRKGYEFDGASVPALLRWFIGPMDPRVIASSLLHDGLYTNPDLSGIGQYYENGVETKKTFTKKEADDLFRRSNEANNMDVVRTTLAYWAVILFGKGKFK
jgi:hypothetical protein